MAEQIGVEAIFSLTNFSKGLSSYEKGLDKAEGSTGSFVANTEKKFSGLGGAIGKVGGILATGLAVGAAAAGAAVVGVGVKGVQAFADFQASMNEVFTLLPGISQSAMNDMSDQVKKFSTDFGVLPEEVVPALYQALSAGVPQDNVFAFLEVANKAAVGGASDLTTAVNGISSVVNAYGADMLSAGQASDIMFTTVRLGKTNFQELSDSMFNVGPTAAALGVGFDQVSAALAAMTLQGTPTSVATTQLRSLMVELSKDGSKTAETFEKLAGKSFVDFIASGHNLSDALAIMEKGAEASDVRLSDLFGSVEAGNAALALTGKGAETFNADLKAMQEAGGATDAAFAQMNTGIQDALDDLKVAWAVALLDIGEKLAPFVQTLADLAGQALPYLTAALGKVLDAIGVVADGFVSLVSAFTSYYDAVTNAGAGTMESLMAITQLPEAIQPAAQAVDKLIGVFGRYLEFAADAGYGTTETQEVINLFPEAIQPAARAIDFFIGDLINYNEAVLDAGYGTIESKEAISLFPAALQPVALAFDDVAGAITKFGSGALTEIKTFVTGGDTEFTNLKAILSTVGNAVSTLFSSLVTYVSSNLPAWKAQLVEWGKAAWDWTVDAATQVVAKLGEWWSAIQTFVTSHAPIWVNVLKEWARAAWNWIVDAAGEVVNKLGEWWSALQTYVTGHAPIWATMLKEWATAAWQWIVDAAGQVAGKLGEWWTAIQKWLDDNEPVFKKKLDEWSFLLYSWISSDETKTGTERALNDWKEKSVFAQLEIFNTELNDQMLDAQATLVGWITDAIPDTVAAVTDWIISLFNAADPTSPAVSPAVSTAQTRLNKALDKMWTVLGEEAAKAGAKIIKAALEAMGLGFLTGEPELTTKAKETNDKALASFDITAWYQRGVELMTNANEGADSQQSALDAAFEAIADAILAFFDVAAWNQRGADLLSNLKSGWDSLKGAMLASVATLAGDMVKKFTEIDWAGAGKSIIDGILKGLKDNASGVLDYLTGLAHDALNAFLSAIDAKSPSKEFAKAGGYIIDGLVLGLQSGAARVYAVSKEIAGSVLGTFLTWSARTQGELSGNLGNVLGMAGNFLSGIKDELNGIEDAVKGILGEDFNDWLDFPWAGKMQPAFDRRNLLAGVVSNLEQQQQIADSLRMQASLVDLVRNAGMNTAQFFSGITLGRNANPVDILRSLTSATQVLNQQLEGSLQAVAKGYDRVVDRMRESRESFGDLLDDFTKEPVDALTAFQNRLAALDEQIALREDELLKTGSDRALITLQDLQTRRAQLTAEIRRFLAQMDQAQQTINRIRQTANSDAQKAIDDYKATFIDPLIESMNSSLLYAGGATRDQFNVLLNQRVDALNRYVVQIEQLAAVQKSMEEPLTGPEAALAKFFDPATVEAERASIIRYMQQVKELGDVEKSVANITGDLADRFREDIFGTLSGYVSNFNLSESSRQSALTSLKGYVGQLKLLREVVKDTSAGASINPLVGRFQTDVMDKLLNQFYDLNTSEAQRLAIIQQYRVEQEKILALQTKQQQLDFLSQQLDLLNQAKQLNEKYDNIISFDAIKEGITFGLNATMDDMLKLTSRILDAMIKTVKSDLGIASPSKVFAEIGEYMMQGLGAGIWNARQVPSMAMAGAVQQVPYSMTNNRSINVNMGGVAINNGMDDIMFEARVRQVVEGLL